jgi:hypothetical protein
VLGDSKSCNRKTKNNKEDIEEKIERRRQASRRARGSFVRTVPEPFRRIDRKIHCHIFSKTPNEFFLFGNEDAFTDVSVCV